MRTLLLSLSLLFSFAGLADNPDPNLNSDVRSCCPRPSAMTEFLHHMGYDNKEQTDFVMCVNHFYDARQAKAQLELDRIDKLVKGIEAELKKIAYKYDIGEVRCSPVDGSPADPKRAEKCHHLVEALNALIDREEVLSGWKDQFHRATQNSAAPSNESAAPPADPPTPSEVLCAKARMAAAMLGRWQERDAACYPDL